MAIVAYEIAAGPLMRGKAGARLAGPPGLDGSDGVDGTDGLPGASAYQVWLLGGNVGTMGDFLASLVGATTVGAIVDATTPGKAIVRATVSLFADISGTAKSTDTYVGFTALTVSRTLVLPAAATFPRGKPLYVADESGVCSPSLSITVKPGGTDTILGPSDNQVVLVAPGQKLALHSNESNQWTFG